MTTPTATRTCATVAIPATAPIGRPLDFDDGRIGLPLGEQFDAVVAYINGTPLELSDLALRILDAVETITSSTPATVDTADVTSSEATR